VTADGRQAGLRRYTLGDPFFKGALFLLAPRFERAIEFGARLDTRPRDCDLDGAMDLALIKGGARAQRSDFLAKLAAQRHELSPTSARNSAARHRGRVARPLTQIVG
jgi:hypothetical protein